MGGQFEETLATREEPCALEPMLHDMLRPLQEQARRIDVTLSLRGGDAIPQVHIDPVHIGWAVTSLVGNALRYVRRGSALYPGGSIAVQLSYDAASKRVVIEVTDDGPGIPEDKLPWLFERKPGDKRPAGLTLKMVHDIVVAHGGTTEVENLTEGGTRIRLRLPA